MNKQEALQILRTVGAIIADSHIVYTSGKHGSAYVDKDMAYVYPSVVSSLCREIALKFSHDEVDAVVAPEKGGIILSQWVAFHLSSLTGREVLAFYAEKEVVPLADPEQQGRKCFAETGKFVVKRGDAQKRLPVMNVLVVEDILTTGNSAAQTISAVRKLSANVVGLGAICNRGGVTTQNLMDVPKLFSLIDIKLETFDETDCPLCASNVPINTKVGKGREYLAKK